MNTNPPNNPNITELDPAPLPPDVPPVMHLTVRQDGMQFDYTYLFLDVTVPLDELTWIDHEVDGTDWRYAFAAGDGGPASVGSLFLRVDIPDDEDGGCRCFAVRVPSNSILN